MGEKKQRELITLEDGREVYSYPSGLLKDVKTGFIVKPAKSTLLTSERATQLQHKRWDDFREKAQARTVERFQELGFKVASSQDVWGELISKRAEVAYKNEGRTGNDAVRLVGQAWGILGDGNGKSSTQNTQINFIGGQDAGEIIRLLLDAGNYMADSEE